MSKKKSKFSSSVERLKGKFSGLFKKSSKAEDGEEYYDDDEFEEYEEDYEEEYEDDPSIEGEEKYEEDYEDDYEGDYEEEYDEDEFTEETDPSMQPLTVSEIKRQQIENGETPPDLPPMNLDDDEEGDYSVDDEEEDFPVTNPSLTEYDLPPLKKSFKTRASDLVARFKTAVATKGKPSFDLKDVKAGPLAKLSEINFDEIFNGFFSPQNRPKIHRIFLASTFVLTAFFTGRMISLFLTPSPTAKLPGSSKSLSLNKSDLLNKKLSQLKNNDLFGAPEESKVVDIPTQKKDTFKEVAVCKEAKRKSSLSIKLMNTVILQDSVKSLASVQVRGKEEFLREGDSLPNMIEVGKIARKKLIFKNLQSRQCEYVENLEKVKGPRKSIKVIKEPKSIKKVLDDAKATGITQNGNSFKIKKEVRQRMLENISEVLTQARAVQIKNPDGTLSFRMTEIVPGSIYSQLNIQEGDMITGINGKKITNMAELMNLFGQIDKIDHFELSLNRGGIEQNLDYDFE